MTTTLPSLMGTFVSLFSLLLGSALASEPATNQHPVFSHFGVTLNVSDVRTSVTFFRDVLGFKLEHYLVGSAKTVTELRDTDPEPYAANLLFGDQTLALQRDERQNPGCGWTARYNIVVQEPAAYYTLLVSRGATVRVMAYDTSKKPFMFSVNDPDGHWFVFMGPMHPD